MNLPEYKIKSYLRSLKAFLGYRADDKWATEFNLSVPDALGLMLSTESYLEHFLSRYPLRERKHREPEVKKVICLWLCEFAVGESK
ncbi:hypothetical protein BST81_25380 [Leptolyngbya sp. 'hensonii']|uniref:hypothetical protein n=1 Tax=Leptolyngbya sp. 'hensonii' TaxID=1922337 RepID=UPI00095020F3|nr:hypothetical protein [Leptolyngbya sp. 'hensonii']OLP15610.1 hypothetical protein BST81_25380 [Leptolyngbya sp. 'hensonii']